MALRDNPECHQTVTIGTNELIGTNPSKLPPALARLMAGQWKKGAIPPKWDGKAAERIVECLERVLSNSQGKLRVVQNLSCSSQVRLMWRSVAQSVKRSSE
jgi:hypothetical protein